jgi:hypothetical protein
MSIRTKEYGDFFPLIKVAECERSKRAVFSLIISPTARSHPDESALLGGRPGLRLLRQCDSDRNNWTPTTRNGTMKPLRVKTLSCVLMLCLKIPLAQNSSEISGFALGTSVKSFGAVGDGATDDTAALRSALAWMATSEACLYFPPGAYKITAELDWIDQHTRLCLRGENFNKSYVIYLGNNRVDAAIHVGNATGSKFSALDITNLGIAANGRAAFAFHGIRIGPPANMDNVAFMGGSMSAFEGDFWNGQTDLRNLIVSKMLFGPPGATNCVNGLTFSSGTWYGHTAASTQFSLSMPTVELCSGTGLNFLHTELVTVNNGQIAQNRQQLYEDCNLEYGCNSIGDTFNNVLLEAGTVPSEIHGPRNTFIGLDSNSLPLKIFGTSNVFEQSIGIYYVQPGAVGNEFRNDFLLSTSTDAGVGTFGVGNYDETGKLAAGPWNRLSSSIYTGPPTAPSGACKFVGWAFSQDGRATYCDGSTWHSKL